MESKILISTDVIADLVRLTNEINDRVESLELIGDEDFMNSLKKSKDQIKNRDFAENGIPFKILPTKELEN